MAALVADGSSIGGLESEIRIPNGDEVSSWVQSAFKLLPGLYTEESCMLLLHFIFFLPFPLLL